MIRLILRLLKITDFEVCSSCKTLKEQLEFERSEKKELLNTLINITNPKVTQAIPQELQPIINTAGLFSRRRAALEQADREKARIIAEKKFVGQPDNTNNQIEKLEEELGVSEGDVN